jgi:hypothetical protein
MTKREAELERVLAAVPVGEPEWVLDIRDRVERPRPNYQRIIDLLDILVSRGLVSRSFGRIDDTHAALMYVRDWLGVPDRELNALPSRL